MSDRVKSLRTIVILLAFFSSALWVMLAFVDDGRSSDPGPQIDPAQHVPYLEQVAAQLSEDPIWVDPVLADTIGEKWVTDEVRSALADSATAVYLLVMPSDAADFTAGDGTVVAAQVAAALGRDGVYLRLDQQGRVADWYQSSKSGQLTLNDGQVAGPTGLAQLISGIDAAQLRAVAAQEEASGFFSSPTWMALVQGATFSVPLWYFLKLCRWLLTRRQRQISGFSRSRRVR